MYINNSNEFCILNCFPKEIQYHRLGKKIFLELIYEIPLSEFEKGKYKYPLGYDMKINGKPFYVGDYSLCSDSDKVTLYLISKKPVKII